MTWRKLSSWRLKKEEMMCKKPGEDKINLVLQIETRMLGTHYHEHKVIKVARRHLVKIIEDNYLKPGEHLEDITWPASFKKKV